MARVARGDRAPPSLVAAAAVVLSIGSRSRVAFVTSVVGLVAILGAGFNGGSFLNYAEDFSLMIMAWLWAIAMGSYLVGVYRIEA